MTIDDIKTKKYICLTMYGKPGDKTIKVSPKTLTLGSDKFIFQWGFPGPDFNVYYYDDYGRTRAFKENEFEWRSGTKTERE